MYKANEWEEIKKQNKFYIPNYEMTFKEFLDIFAVFNTKAKAYAFVKKLLTDGVKFAKEFEGELPSPLQTIERNEYVIGVDYGFFLNTLINFIIENGGIVDEKEKKKVDLLIRMFFGFSDKHIKYNYSSQILMKELFGRIYGFTNYKNLDLKGRVFYDYFAESSNGNIYNLHLFFVRKKGLTNAFVDKENFKSLVEKIENLSTKLVTKINFNKEDVKDLFNYEKLV